MQPALRDARPLGHLRPHPCPTRRNPSKNARQGRLPLHVRIGLGRPSGQGRRPDQRYRAGRVPGGRPAGARGLRDAGHHQPHHPGRRDARPRQCHTQPPDPPWRARRCATSATTRKASPGATPRWNATCTPSPPTSPWGVDSAGNKDEGAGDQGIMFGYATTETDSLMPAPIHYAHLILRTIRDLRRAGDARVAGLLPDAKSQVTLRYVDGKPMAATSIVLSTQHERGHGAGGDTRLAPPADRGRAAGGLDVRGRRALHQPHRQFRHRRAGRRLRADGTQDHRGHLWRRGPRTAAARSPARTPPRWTAVPPMPRGIWPRTWSPRAWPSAAPYRSATPSA